MLNSFILSVSIFMLATAPVIIKFSSLHPLAILVWRLVIVCFLLIPFVYNKKLKLSTRSFRHIFFAACFMFLHFITWFSGVKLLPVGLITIIYATNPIYTAIFGYLFIKEKFSSKFILAFAFSILGIVIASYGSVTTKGSLLGVFLIFLAAVFYSAYMVYSKHNRTNVDNAVYSFYLNLMTCLIGLVFVLLGSSFMNTKDFIPTVPFEWFILFLLALFPSLLGHSLMTYSVKHFNLNFISCFKLFSPLFASFLAYLFFKEEITEYIILGFSFVAIGVLFALPWKKKKWSFK